MIEDREYSDQQLDEVLNKSEEWFNKFAESSFFDELNNYEQDEAGFIIKRFSEFMYNYFLMLPEEWDISTTEECCLELFPRKISADTAFYELISPVLSSFCRFLSKEKLLKNANALSDCVFKLNDQIIENASNSSNWGPAKSFVMMAKECGVNIENQNDLDNFVNVYNDYQLEKEEDEMLDYMFEEREPFHRETPKVGRNEPCPCGSGKKYKKCCGR